MMSLQRSADALDELIMCVDRQLDLEVAPGIARLRVIEPEAGEVDLGDVSVDRRLERLFAQQSHGHESFVRLPVRGCLPQPFVQFLPARAISQRHPGPVDSSSRTSTTGSSGSHGLAIS